MEIARVYVTRDEAVSQETVAVRETVCVEQLFPTLKVLREIPCKEPPFEPRDKPYGECFMIKYRDGCFQLLSECRNDYFNQAYRSIGHQSVDFDAEAFSSPWNQGFGD